MELTLDKKLQGFQLIAQEKLQSIICSIPGKKDLIIEPTLIKPLEHVCAASWLKLKGIQRIFKYDAEHAIQRSSEDQVQIYMIRSHIPTFQNVLQQIHVNEQQQPTDIDAAVKYFHIICVPICFAFFHTQLEEEGLYGIVQLHRFNWDFIYIDRNILSLEISHVFSSTFYRADTSLLTALAHSLRVLQLVCRCPELILSLGTHATQIANMLQQLATTTKSNLLSKNSEKCGDFDAMLIIDRDKDYASSILTPTIYAGLLLEVFTQRTGEIDLTAENKITKQELHIFTKPTLTDNNATLSSTTAKNTTKRATNLNVIRLNSWSDEIYAENRYRHFSQASSMVRTQAKSIGVEMQKLNNMNIDEMHSYVARQLPKVAELKTKVLRHLNASEKVISLLGHNFQRLQTLEEDILNNVARKRTQQDIEELLATAAQRFNTLRLLCLQHICAGVAADELARFVRSYCNCFGHQHLSVFEQLARADLLPALPDEVAGDSDKLNKSAKLLLAQLPLPNKFQQTEFQATANRLKLLVNANNETDAHVNETTTAHSVTNTTTDILDNACPSYVFNRIYIPLVAQMCQLLLKSCNIEDCATKLGMLQKLHVFVPNQQLHSTNLRTYAQNVKMGELKDVFPLRMRSIFVFIVGGATYAEIAACDLVSRLTGAQIVIGSDSIISGSDLIASAFGDC